MLDVQNLPYLTTEIPGIGGKIKVRPEDFVVREVPLYHPCGEGTHVYFQIEKTGIATLTAVDEIARALGRPSRDIGLAGLKDANAVTTQMLSVEHIEPSRIEQLQLSRIRILSISRHRNKLKLGHLSGNRFRIRIREVDIDRVDDVRKIMEVLNRRGVPNYFGAQRFGQRGDTWKIGRAMLKQDYEQALEVMLGKSESADFGDVKKARELYDAREYAKAADTWPYPFRDERRACGILAKTGGNIRRAFGSIDKRLRRLFISAYQSQLFNQVVAQRIDSLDKLFEGDLAWIHCKGAVFKVEDPEIEQPRCDAFGISPTGPLFGPRMAQTEGKPGQIEQDLLDKEGMTVNDWRSTGQGRKRGRRALRFQPKEVSVTAGQDNAGPYIEVGFCLESGCYATTVLREICKSLECQVEESNGEES